MTGVTSGVIEVLRQVPAELVEGVRNGTLKLCGGVVRDQGGQIVGHLIEGARLVRDSGLDPQILLEAVGDARLAAEIASGIGVLNLCAQAAGFAMMARRLDRIAGTIDRLRADLRAVGDGVDWLDRFNLAGLRASVAAAIDTAVRAERRGAGSLYDAAKAQAVTARHQLVNLLVDMDAGGRVLRQHRLYAEFLRSAVVLAVVETKCDVTAEGPAIAFETLSVTLGQLVEATAPVRRLASDFRAAPLLLAREGLADRPALQASAGTVQDLLDRLDAHRPLLALQRDLNLDLTGWRELTGSDDPDRTLTCLRMLPRTADVRPG